MLYYYDLLWFLLLKLTLITYVSEEPFSGSWNHNIIAEIDSRQTFEQNIPIHDTFHYETHVLPITHKVIPGKLLTVTILNYLQMFLIFVKITFIIKPIFVSKSLYSWWSYLIGTQFIMKLNVTTPLQKRILFQTKFHLKFYIKNTQKRIWINSSWMQKYKASKAIEIYSKESQHRSIRVKSSRNKPSNRTK